MGGTPSSSTVNLESDDSLDEVVPLGLANINHFVSGHFARPNQNLDVSNFNHLNILERPSLAPTGPGGSFLKRRRVASAEARSPLGRPAADDDDDDDDDDPPSQREDQRAGTPSGQDGEAIGSPLGQGQGFSREARCRGETAGRRCEGCSNKDAPRNHAASHCTNVNQER